MPVTRQNHLPKRSSRRLSGNAEKSFKSSKPAKPSLSKNKTKQKSSPKTSKREDKEAAVESDCQEGLEDDVDGKDDDDSRSPSSIDHANSLVTKSNACDLEEKRLKKAVGSPNQFTESVELTSHFVNESSTETKKSDCSTTPPPPPSPQPSVPQPNSLSSPSSSSSALKRKMFPYVLGEPFVKCRRIDSKNFTGNYNVREVNGVESPTFSAESPKVPAPSSPCNVSVNPSVKLATASLSLVVNDPETCERRGGHESSVETSAETPRSISKLTKVGDSKPVPIDSLIREADLLRNGADDENLDEEFEIHLVENDDGDDGDDASKDERVLIPIIESKCATDSENFIEKKNARADDFQDDDLEDDVDDDDDPDKADGASGTKVVRTIAMTLDPVTGEMVEVETDEAEEDEVEVEESEDEEDIENDDEDDEEDIDDDEDDEDDESVVDERNRNEKQEDEKTDEDEDDDVVFCGVTPLTTREPARIPWVRFDRRGERREYSRRGLQRAPQVARQVEIVDRGTMDSHKSLISTLYKSGLSRPLLSKSIPTKNFPAYEPKKPVPFQSVTASFQEAFKNNVVKSPIVSSTGSQFSSIATATSNTTCPVCTINFVSKNILDKHLEVVHPGMSVKSNHESVDELPFKTLDPSGLRPAEKLLIDIGENLANEFVLKDSVQKQTERMQAKHKQKHLDRTDVEGLKRLHADLSEVTEKNRPFEKISKMQFCRYPSAAAAAEGAPQCGFRTESALSLDFHRLFPHKDRFGRMECNFCRFTTRQDNKYMLHMKEAHKMKGYLVPKPYPYSCGLCTFECKKNYQLNRHQERCFNVWEREQRSRRNLGPSLEDSFYYDPYSPNPKLLAQFHRLLGSGRNSSVGTVFHSKPVAFNSSKFIPDRRGSSPSSNCSSPGSPLANHDAPSITSIVMNVTSEDTARSSPRPTSVTPVLSVSVTLDQDENSVQTLKVIPSSSSPTPIVVAPVRILPKTNVETKFADAFPSGQGYEVCEICGGFVKDVASLCIHFLNAHRIDIGQPPIMKPKTLLCKVCKRGFWTIYGRIRHTRVAHATGKAVDGAGSSMEVDLTEEKENERRADSGRRTKNKGLSPYQCSLCALAFDSFDGWTAHIKAKHSIPARNKALNSSVNEDVDSQPWEEVIEEDDDGIIITKITRPRDVPPGPARKVGKAPAFPSAEGIRRMQAFYYNRPTPSPEPQSVYDGSNNCVFCSQKNSSFASLRAHLSSAHDIELDVVKLCEICGDKFGFAGADCVLVHEMYLDHMEEDHCKEFSVPCLRKEEDLLRAAKGLKSKVRGEEDDDDISSCRNRGRSERLEEMGEEIGEKKEREEEEEVTVERKGENEEKVAKGAKSLQDEEPIRESTSEIEENEENQENSAQSTKTNLVKSENHIKISSSLKASEDDKNPASRKASRRNSGVGTTTGSSTRVDVAEKRGVRSGEENGECGDSNRRSSRRLGGAQRAR